MGFGEKSTARLHECAASKPLPQCAVAVGAPKGPMTLGFLHPKLPVSPEA